MSPIREKVAFNDDVFRGQRMPFNPGKKSTFSSEKRFLEPKLL
jgi:hypothetical protein